MPVHWTMIEVPLAGGNVTNGVFRSGDTVRRPVSPHGRQVHRLLRHLEAEGFDKCPRLLGIDDQGREILSFIPGSADMPEGYLTSMPALEAAAKLLKTYHAATENLAMDAGDSWAYAYPDPSRHEVICHNDFAPYNLIFGEALPVAIIDFDLAGPGPRLRDLAYLAYWTAPLSFAADDMAARAEAELAKGCPRLRRICAVYGTQDFGGLLGMVGEVLHHMASEAAAARMIGSVAAAKLDDGGHFAHWAREARAFDQRRSAVLAALTP